MLLSRTSASPNPNPNPDPNPTPTPHQVDEPSSALVAKFYATLRASPATSQAEALRAAMLAVRKARRWESPLFWAGCTLTLTRTRTRTRTRTQD